jgi:DNA helicase-2/ATP-dependent DNA helicase PcrA
MLPDTRCSYSGGVTPDELVGDLDPDQRHAVTTPSTLVAVIAGAGSGKTRVLTRRIAHRIATGTAEARHTLALTFTREAAGELRRRLAATGTRERIEAGTFHSVALGVLRQRWADTDRRPSSVTSDRRRLLAEVSGPGRGGGFDALVAEVEWASARGLDATSYPAAARREGRRPSGGVESVAEALDAYRTIKRRRGVVDFDDLVGGVVAEASRDPSFAEALRWRYRHVLVDEAQDLNPLQHRLVDLLRTGRDDVFLVGDPSQAIYAFNGADPGLLIDVDARFPGIEVVRLPTNHRSAPEIVGAGAHVLRASGQPVELRARRGPGGSVTTLVGVDDVDEARHVASVVSNDRTAARDGNVAVLVRTHAQVGRIVQALTDANIPVRDPAATSPTRQAAIRKAGSTRGAAELRALAHDTLDDPAAGPDDRAVAAAALSFLRERTDGDGSTFRAWIATDDPFGDGAAGGVEVLTFHAAKGREWPTVVVAGVERGLSPHSSATTAAARAEEGRLLYVAVTRATDRLVLTRAERRGGYVRQPCPWLDGLADTAGPPDRPVRVRRTARPPDLRSRLLEWRATRARRAGVLPEDVCSNRDVDVIVEHRPTTAAGIAEVTSMGPLTAQRYADEIVRLVTSS